jgi:uncharacterized protein YacL
MIGKENIASKIVESGGKLHVKSALNPILWLCAIITIPSLISVPFIDETPIWLIILIIAPVITAILGFLFLLFLDRDKLQSEEYQLRKRSMEMIQEKGESQPRIIDTDTIEVIENPDTKELPENNNQDEK